MRPIFVCGCQRSGTTLLGSLLGSHSRCVATPESQFVTDVYRWHAARGTTFDLARTLAQINKHFRFKLWNLEVSVQDAESAGVSTYEGLIAYLVKTYAVGVEKENADVWTDHTPAHVESAATLSKLFPDAKFVHLVRDGRAVASSIKSLDWGVNDMRQLSHKWIARVGHGLAAETHLGDRVMRVRYEDLTGDPEGTLRRICEFAELSYEAQMPTGDGFLVPKYTKKQHDLVGTPPDPARANAWMKRLSPEDIEVFEYSSRDMLECLGYEPLYGAKAKAQGSQQRYRALLADALWYRPLDRYKTRKKQRQALEQLRAQGFLNRK